MGDILTCYRKYVAFSGRARRREYWLFLLFVIVVTTVLIGVASAMADPNPPSGILLLPFRAWLVLNFLPSLAVAVRRLHDTNRSGWWYLLIFIPFGVIVILIFMVLRGTDGPNRFGEDPLLAQKKPKDKAERLWQPAPQPDADVAHPRGSFETETAKIVLPDRDKSVHGNTDPTELVRSSGAVRTPPLAHPASGDRTILVGAGGSAGSDVAPAAASDDPVVGWLAVVDGPGRGRWRQLGAGGNDIGRAPSSRVCLDFGDQSISRERHAVVTFDPRSSKFYVQQGDGKNLAYLGDAPLLTPQELKSGQEITLGSTRLRFIALCGPDFAW